MDRDFRIVLMCAEKEPLECHRTILVARHLAAEAYLRQEERIAYELSAEAALDPSVPGSLAG